MTTEEFLEETNKREKEMHESEVKKNEAYIQYLKESSEMEKERLSLLRESIKNQEKGIEIQKESNETLILIARAIRERG